MMTIVEFLTARLDEDEAVALAAPGSEWKAFKQDDVAGASVYDEQWVLLYPQHYDHDNPLSSDPTATGPMYIEKARDELCAHIARQDPARILAEIAAKRLIIRWHSDNPHECEGPLGSEYVSDDDSRPCSTMCALTLPYADHADYQQEWKP